MAPSAAVAVGNNSGAGVLAGIGIAAIILTRLKDIVSFSGLGIKATLERKVAEVDEILEQLRMISKSLARAGLQQMAMSGQWLSGLNTSAKFRSRDDIVVALEKIKVPGIEIIEIQNVWISVFGNMLLNIIVAEAAKNSALDEVRQEVKELTRVASYNLPTPDSLSFWSVNKPPSVILYCNEYRTLLESGKMTDPDIIPFNLNMQQSWLNPEGESSGL